MNRLIRQLHEAQAYPHPTQPIQLIETHISWILLTGDVAYKVKKPVSLEFVDFSTLERRRHFCELEVQINRRFAPQLYLGVVPIASVAGQARIQGDGPAVEYAVKMRQFPQEALISRQLAADRLEPHSMDALAETIAEYHRTAPVAAADSPWIEPAAVTAPAVDNCEYLAQHLDDPAHLHRVADLDAWTRRQGRLLDSALRQRAVEGFVRECHGDLHLANILYLDHRFLAFDAIEFNEAFRWIDTANEVAFVLMELDDWNRPAFAARLLNRYLEVADDYGALAVMTYYLVYRALVRAKVDLIRRQQRQHADHADVTSAGAAYLELAQQYCRGRQRALWITCGPAASGKSTAALRIVQRYGAVRVRSDVQRKRLAGLHPDQVAAAPVGQGIYDSASTAATYQRLLELARQILQNGWPAVVDASFLRQHQRNAFQQLANSLGVPFHILACQAPADQLKQRLAQRRGDPSDASLQVLEHQLRTLEALSDQERAFQSQPPAP